MFEKLDLESKNEEISTFTQEYGGNWHDKWRIVDGRKQDVYWSTAKILNVAMQTTELIQRQFPHMENLSKGIQEFFDS